MGQVTPCLVGGVLPCLVGGVLPLLTVSRRVLVKRRKPLVERIPCVPVSVPILRAERASVHARLGELVCVHRFGQPVAFVVLTPLGAFVCILRSFSWVYGGAVKNYVC